GIKSTVICPFIFDFSFQAAVPRTYEHYNVPSICWFNLRIEGALAIADQVSVHSVSEEAPQRLHHEINAAVICVRSACLEKLQLLFRELFYVEAEINALVVV